MSTCDAIPLVSSSDTIQSPESSSHMLSDSVELDSLFTKAIDDVVAADVSTVV